jgi:hypothetical protein
MKVGQTISFLTLLEIRGEKTGQFRCTRCGTEKSFYIPAVQNFEIKSCGCYRRDFISEAATKHGDSDTKEYSVWAHLKQHAQRTDSIVDSRWDDFRDFIYDMGRMADGTDHLARYDITKPYSKENCVWAGHSQTMMEKRPHANNKTGIKGLSLKKERGVVKCYQAHIASDGFMYSKRFPLTNEGFLQAIAYLVTMREHLHGEHAHHFIPAAVLDEAANFFEDTTVIEAVEYSLANGTPRK